VEKIEPAEVYIIAVPTPQDDGEADLIYVLQAVDFIISVYRPGDAIVVESTVGPLDCKKRIIPAFKKVGLKDFKFAHCPERAIPGNTLYEMVNNDRIVGGVTIASTKYVSNLYSSFVKGKLFLTDETTAATVKLMENTYRDVNIALANEFSIIAEKIGLDVWKAIELANKHPRVNILQPGPGVGGHCIPIDPWFLSKILKEGGLIKVVRNINDGMANHIVSRLKHFMKKHKLVKSTIGILGYAYKKNVGDCRETPAEKIIELLSKNYKVLVNDPFVKGEAVTMEKIERILKVSSVIVLITDHDLYKNILFRKYSNVKLVFDTRNLFTKINMERSKALLYKLGVGSDN